MTLVAASTWDVVAEFVCGALATDTTRPFSTSMLRETRIVLETRHGDADVRDRDLLPATGVIGAPVARDKIDIPIQGSWR